MNAPERISAALLAGTLHRAVELHRRGRLAEAESLYHEILAENPRHFDALQLLGTVELQRGRFEEARRRISDALSLNPRSPTAHVNLGFALLELKRPEEALASCDSALALKPDHADALSNRGNALKALRRHEEALASYDRALAIRPDFAVALYNRALSLQALRRTEDALASVDRALASMPEFSEAFMVRGNLLRELHRFDEAVASFDRALAIREGYPEALCNRGTALLELQRYEEALASYDKAVALRPDYVTGYSNRIYGLDFVPGVGFAEHQEARRRWYQALGGGCGKPAASHANRADPTRKLVVGYVSADFKRHSAAFCFGPVLERHDRANFEVVCYSGVEVEDDRTGEFRRHADKWRSVSDLSDEALAERIRADKVDILIDLSGHTTGNRLLVFARKPAPVQVTGFGYGGGTGLPAIDYLFSDAVTIPEAVRPLFAESVVDLPCLGPFEPPENAPGVAELPALSRGAVTFGCLNRFGKVSQGALDLWARILRTVPGSRLLLKDAALDNPATRARVTGLLAGQDIGAERIELRGGTSRKAHLSAYSDVDISLDPFPHNGGMSTWESLWMGAPVVAKLGNSVPSRVSGAVLHAIGLDDWIAVDDDEYVALAVRQATDLQALAGLRRGMRERISASEAGNLDMYTRAVEAAYRKMWRTYLERSGANLEAAGDHHP